MNREKKELERSLSEISLFSCLPDGKRSQMAGSTRTVRLKAGETLGTQGKTPVEGVYIVRSGSLERYYENRGKRILGGRLGPGDVYGAASLLINAGLSIRTVVAAEPSVLFCIPKKIFLECSSADQSVYKRFADTLQHWMEDETHAGVMGISRAMRFLNDTPPFSFLPETELEELASIVSTVNHPKGKVLFTQESSHIDALHIIVSGAAERYYEEKGEKKLRGQLGEGETYGGISLLINKGRVVRSLQTMEDTRFYKIPAKHFLDICRKHPFVSEYFTDTFGRRMLDQSY
ncbi:MAG: cyclic nucleotide-binding domain-containing protein, partial [Desulfobacteraceae bacterium]|nr:cyclic nucleotide-binding domain-containing protein [Desulfobacteraceae bacterium]